MRWVPLFFAGVTAVLAKCGIKRTDSTVATAIRTVVVLLFSWLMVCLVTPRTQLSLPSGKTLCFLILSGICTGASWLCYFRALQLGRINPVMAVDKSKYRAHRVVFVPVFAGAIYMVEGVWSCIACRGYFFDVGPGVKQTQRFTHAGNTARGTTYNGQQRVTERMFGYQFPTAGINTVLRKTNRCMHADHICDRHIGAKCEIFSGFFQSIGANDRYHRGWDVGETNCTCTDSRSCK